MNVKFSAKFDGKCDLCKKNGRVFTLGDEDTKKAVTICEICVKEGTITSPVELIEKHGKVNDEAFKPAVRYERKPTAG